MKTRARSMRTLSHQAVGNYFYLAKEENLLCCKSPMHPPGAMISLSADQNRLSPSEHLTYGFKAKLISSPVVRWQAIRSHPKPSLTQSRASQSQPHYLARKDRQGNVSSLYSRYHHCPRYHHALIRKMSLHQPSNETSPMVPLCLINRSSVLYQTERCSFKRQRWYHHKGRLSQSEVRTHRIGQLHRHQR